MSTGGDRPLLLVGAGKMGAALLQGWLESGVNPARLTVLDPEPSAELRKLAARKGIVINPDIGAMPPPAVIILAVKPQIMDTVLPGLRQLVSDRTVFLSVAAGRTIASMQAILGQKAMLVRTIPNTPAAVGQGMTVAVATTQVTPRQRRLCQTLLEAVGKVEWVEDENLIDAATALSGSGPAYVFYLTECMAKAGALAGLDAELAARMARQTVIGAGALMQANSNTEAAQLRRNVTSPGGTTAAALEVLMAGEAMADLMARAVAAARRRSEELAK
jgi:pyrroline-5-carboxylate reductase